MHYVYILASKKNGTLYVGFTSNLKRRAYQHRHSSADAFTKKYSIYLLVYFEKTTDIISAVKREKQLKAWNRQWKIELIEKDNPNWMDLYTEITA